MAECTVQELALRVRDGHGDGERLPRFALFLGAGASIASGIPGTESMVRLFREKLEERRRAEGDRRGFNRWARERYNWDSKAGDYSNFFEAFEPTENGRARHIEELVSRGTPSFGYLCLAQLLSGGYLNTVVTTNFDELAYEACALWTGVRPRVYAYGAVSEAIRQETGRPTILKLHGDFLYSRLKNTGTEVARVDPNMESEVRRILSGPERYELIVSGYGGEDGSIMELLKGVPDQRALYWCVYRDNPLSERVEELIKRSNMFLVKTEGFDRLMDELLNTVGFTLPDLEQSVREQREAIVEIIGESGSPYADSYVARTEEAMTAESVDSGLRGAQTGVVHANLALEAHNALSKADVDRAVSARRRMVERDPNNPISLNNFGVLLNAAGQTEEALEVLQRSLKLRPNNAVVALANLGAALLDDGQLKESIASLERSAHLRPNSPATLRNLGIALCEGGRRGEGEQIFEQVTKLPGDDPAAEFARAGALLGLGQTSDGLELVRNLCRQDPLPTRALVYALPSFRRLARLGFSGADESASVIEQSMNRLRGEVGPT